MANIIETVNLLNSHLDKLASIDKGTMPTLEDMENVGKESRKIKSYYVTILNNIIDGNECLSKEEKGKIFRAAMRYNKQVESIASQVNGVSIELSKAKVGAIKTYKVNTVLNPNMFATDATMTISDLFKDIYTYGEKGYVEGDLPFEESTVLKDNIELDMSVNILFDVVVSAVYQIFLSFEIVKEALKITRDWTIKNYKRVVDYVMCALDLPYTLFDSIIGKDGTSMPVFTKCTAMQLYFAGAFNIDLPIVDVTVTLAVGIYDYIINTKNYSVLTKLLEFTIFNQDIFISNNYLAHGGIYSYVNAVTAWWLNNAVKHKWLTEVEGKNSNYILSSVVHEAICTLTVPEYHSVIEENSKLLVQNWDSKDMYEVLNVNQDFIEYITGIKSLQIKRGMLALIYIETGIGKCKYVSLECYLLDEIAWQWINLLNAQRTTITGITRVATNLNTAYYEILRRVSNLLEDLRGNKEKYTALTNYIRYLYKGNMLGNGGNISLKTTDALAVLYQMRTIRSYIEADIKRIKEESESGKHFRVKTLYDYVMYMVFAQVQVFYTKFGESFNRIGMQKYKKVLQEASDIDNLMVDINAIVAINTITEDIDYCGFTDTNWLYWKNIEGDVLEEARIELANDIYALNRYEIINSVIQYQRENKDWLTIDMVIVYMENTLADLLRKTKLYIDKVDSEYKLNKAVTESKASALEGRKRLEESKKLEKSVNKQLDEISSKLQRVEKENVQLREKAKGLSEEEKQELRVLRNEKQQLEALVDKQERLLQQMNAKLGKLRSQLSTYAQEDTVEEIIEEEVELTFAEKAAKLREKRIVLYSGITSLPNIENELGFEVVYCPKDGNLKSVTGNIKGKDCLVIETGHIGHSMCERIESVNKANSIPMCLIDSTNTRIICDTVYEFCVRKGVL